MVENDSQICRIQHLAALKIKYGAVQKTFDKIDRLEIMVARIKADMDKVDRQLVDAEQTVAVDATLQPLRALMKPSFIFVSWFDLLQIVAQNTEGIWVPNDPKLSVWCGDPKYHHSKYEHFEDWIEEQDGAQN